MPESNRKCGLEGVSLLPAIFLNQQNHRDRRIFPYAIDGFEAGEIPTG